MLCKWGFSYMFHNNCILFIPQQSGFWAFDTRYAGHTDPTVCDWEQVLPAHNAGILSCNPKDQRLITVFIIDKICKSVL